MKTKIVAFMDNPPFPLGTPKEKIHAFKTIQTYRQEVLKSTGVGYRLKQAFGDLFERIWWDAVAPEIVDDRRKKSPVDIKHVEAIVAIQKPDLILVFGDNCKEALDKSVVVIGKTVMYCCNPNARNIQQSELDMFSWEVFDFVHLHDRNDEFTANDRSE